MLQTFGASKFHLFGPNPSFTESNVIKRKKNIYFSIHRFFQGSGHMARKQGGTLTCKIKHAVATI